MAMGKCLEGADAKHLKNCQVIVARKEIYTYPGVVHAPSTKLAGKALESLTQAQRPLLVMYKLTRMTIESASSDQFCMLIPDKC